MKEGQDSTVWFYLSNCHFSVWPNRVGSKPGGGGVSTRVFPHWVCPVVVFWVYFGNQEFVAVRAPSALAVSPWRGDPAVLLLSAYRAPTPVSCVARTRVATKRSLHIWMVSRVHPSYTTLHHLRILIEFFLLRQTVLSSIILIFVCRIFQFISLFIIFGLLLKHDDNTVCPLAFSQFP